jgi:uncharacterized phage protein (TIGR02220 family)
VKKLKSIRLDGDLIELIDALAEKNRRTFSNQVEVLLWNAVGEKKNAANNQPGKPDDAMFLIDYLNQVTGKRFKPVESNLKLLRARIEEGHSKEDIIAVIDRQNLCWPKGDEMRKYMRPETLFNATKFNQYVGELGQPIEGKANGHNKPILADTIREQAVRARAMLVERNRSQNANIVRGVEQDIPGQVKRLPDS